jgi:multidrug efflux pump
MSLSEVCIRRPVLATVLALVIVLFGGVAFTFLGVREYPAVDPPIVTVNTTYPGAHPDVIASQITEPLEQQINGIEGIRSVSSTSSDERSTLRVEFEIEVDLERAANDVRDKVAQAARDLPPDAELPVVQKADADAEPIVLLAVRSATRSILEVNDFADRVVAERIETIPGVSSIRIFGEQRYAMRLWLDPARLAAHGLTVLDVQQALLAQNVDLPSGRIEGEQVELALRTAGRLVTPDDFDAMILETANGRQIELRDVGRAELGAENLRTGNKLDLEPVIALGVIPQPNTNAIAIADELYARLDDIRRDLPADVSLEVAYDFTTFVRRSIREVAETIAIAFVLVTAVIWAFLRSWRSTVVPVIAIPVSIVSAFFVMYLAGFSINVLTLVGMVLAIGIVCDDAILVLENIHAKLEQGMSPLEAALAGSREIYFAVLSTTAALCAVFVPVIFLSGLTGRLFREFGVVLMGVIAVSAFVALTLTPMMCRQLLVAQPEGAAHAAGGTGRFIERYRRSLAAVLRRPRAVAALLAGLVVLSVVLVRTLPAELAPLEDRSNIRVNVVGPEGSSFEFLRHWMDRLAVLVSDRIPGVAHVFAISGPGGRSVSTGLLSLYLTDPEQRELSQAEIYARLADELDEVTAVRSLPAQPPTIGDRRGGQPVQYVLQAATLEDLIAVLPKFLERAGESPALRFVDADLKVNRPEGLIAIDRARAAELGISVHDIARTLQLAYGGARFGFFLREGRQYDVVGQVAREDRNDPRDLQSLHVRTAGGGLVPLDSVVRFSETVSPAAIYRYDRFTSATVTAGLAPGHAIGDGLEALDEIAAELLPPDMRTSLAGQSRDFADSSSSLLFAFVLALAIVYLVLAAQFESFRDPLIILVTVPLSISGALLGLFVFGQTLNVFSQIGMILLIGLVTKNGILIVEFANQRRAAGLAPREAVLEAASARLRPVVMTSLSTVFGFLPIAIAFGGAAGSRQPLGIAVVFGLVFSTALTLYVVPAVYLVLSRKRAPEAAGAAAADYGRLAERGSPGA